MTGSSGKVERLLALGYILKESQMEIVLWDYAVRSAVFSPLDTFAERRKMNVIWRSYIQKSQKSA